MKLESLAEISSHFEHNPLRITEAKEKGKKVIGTYCIYGPQELFLAIDAIPVSLCGTRQDSIPIAETVLPRTICPLIKSSFGYLLNDACPYLAAADLVVGETTCDGKKKMFEIMGEQKNLIVLELPSQQSSAMAQKSWIEQFNRLEARLEKDFGVKIDKEKLLKAIDLVNRETLALKRVFDTSKHSPAPATGMQLLELGFKTSFFPDKELGIKLLNKVADELEERIEKNISPFSKDTPRIILTGVPTGMGSHKAIQLLEEVGASVILMDNCTSYKKTRNYMPLDDSKSKKDLIEALAARYLEIPCSVMSPNPGRYEVLKNLADEFKADAVVDLTWQGCHTYNVESYYVKKYVQEELGLPFLQLETDYSESDTEQLRVRIEAFLEMIKG